MTKIISLNELASPPALILDVDGVKHPLVPATIETFVANVKDIEELQLNASPVKELELTVRILARAFPSLTEKQISNWSIEQIQNLADMARKLNGEVVSTDEQEVEKAKKTGKPPKAS